MQKAKKTETINYPIANFWILVRMFSLMFRATILIIALLLCFNSYAQIEPIYSNYQHYTTEDGLPLNYVSYLAQDKDGFIWVATLNGLTRFDGQSFIHFNSNSKNKNYLSTSQILDLIVDDHNQLWILHFNHKVDVMDAETFEVRRDVEPVRTIPDEEFMINMGHKRSVLIYFISDNRKKNWFIKKDTSYLLIDTASVMINNFFNKRGNGEMVYGYDFDQKERVWVMTNEGLEYSDKTLSETIHLPIPETFNFSPGIRNKCPVVCLPNDKVIFAYANRLFLYDENKSSYRELDIPRVPRIRDSDIFFMTTDHEDRVVFEYEGYILRVEHDDSVTALWAHPQRNSFQTTGILIDKSNTLWVGVNTGGLYKIDLLTPSFNAEKYKSNFVTDLLISELDVEEESLPDFWKKKEWAYEFRYLYTEEGRLFLKYDYYNYRGPRSLFYINENRLTPINTGAQSLKHFVGLGYVNGVLHGLDKYGWLHTWNNLTELPSKIRFKEIEGRSDETISEMVVDDDYNWVISVDNKLYQIEEGKMIKTFSPGNENSSLIDLIQDPQEPKILWIATLGGGLIKWDKGTQSTVRNYTIDDGLSDNSIGAIESDTNGNIWLATFNGINKLNSASEVFTLYSKKDGLIENEFNRHHSFKLPDGRIALGGTIGYVLFDPSLFKEDTFQPKIAITDITINNESIMGDSSILKNSSLNTIRQIDLNYDKNSIELEFGAMQFNAPEKNIYRYKLSGYTDDWVSLEKDTKIKFDKLRSGDYDLYLNASNTNGTWSSNVKQLSISVYPPPWLSWWAITIYTLFGALSIYLYWKNYRQRIIRKQEEAFNIREAKRLKEVDDIKTRFFSNITHEFRTPLTLILSPLEKELREKKHSKEVNSILESNYRQGSKLLDLVNQLLDISKLESGQMQAHKSVGDLDQFFRTITDQFADYAHEKGINFQFINHGVEGQYLLEKSHLEKVIVNLLSNAIKFTPNNGAVSLTIWEAGSHKIIVEVRDTGIGIPKDQIEKLFDRFYQVDGSDERQQEGTGIGLSLVKELVELIGGTVDVKSEVGKGTSFELELPLEKVLSDTQSIKKSVSNTQNKENDPFFLVVEDNDELRSFIVDSLESRGRVISVSNGQEAWDIVENELPDIIISDVMMPVMNGYDLCEKVKSDLRTSHISFIMLTAKTAQESKELGLGAGADEYLTKPFRVKELELRIENLLRQKENIKQHYREKLLVKTSLESEAKSENKFLEKVYDFLDSNLSDSNLKVESLARDLGMSKSTLNRKMRSLLDISTSDFVQQYRIQKSTLYLAEGGPISNVAYKVGFESPSYFSQCFKEVHEQTPSEYQNHIKSRSSMGS